MPGRPDGWRSRHLFTIINIRSDKRHYEKHSYARVTFNRAGLGALLAFLERVFGLTAAVLSVRCRLAEQFC